MRYTIVSPQYWILARRPTIRPLAIQSAAWAPREFVGQFCLSSLLNVPIPSWHQIGFQGSSKANRTIYRSSLVRLTAVVSRHHRKRPFCSRTSFLFRNGEQRSFIHVLERPSAPKPLYSALSFVPLLPHLSSLHGGHMGIFVDGKVT